MAPHSTKNDTKENESTQTGSTKKKRGFFSWFNRGKQSEPEQATDNELSVVETATFQKDVSETEVTEIELAETAKFTTTEAPRLEETKIEEITTQQIITLKNSIDDSYTEENSTENLQTQESIETALTAQDSLSGETQNLSDNTLENDLTPSIKSDLHAHEYPNSPILENNFHDGQSAGELIESTPLKDDNLAEIHPIQEADTRVAELVHQNNHTEQEQEQAPQPQKLGFFARLKQSLVKTKQNIGSGFLSLFSGKKIDDELFEELEEQLLIADVGVETTQKIIRSLTEHASRHELKDASLLYDKLKQEMARILETVDKPLSMNSTKPFVILMVGVNGVGKTTTIGKLAKQFQAEGKSVMLAAGDTFRAAAVEQLQVWGERNNIPVIAQHTGADSASVIYDAFEAAKARNIDILIADTAGRLQNKSHLMDELKKIVRVMKKQDDAAPHEIMLTLDAGTGQNAVSQAKLFNEAVGLTGITLTKLDGTAKGGVIFSLADQFSIPVRYIGVGEKIDDLRSFNAKDFIEALFER